MTYQLMMVLAQIPTVPAIMMEGMISHQIKPWLHGESGMQSPSALAIKENPNRGTATIAEHAHPHLPPAVPPPRYLL